MAKGTTELETLKGPAAPADEYEVPILDSEDDTLLQTVTTEEEKVEGGEEDVTPEPKPKVEVTVKPSPVEPAPVPVAEVIPAPRPLTPIEREERRKRKEATQKWKDALQEQDRLRARLSELNQDVEIGEFKVPQARIEALKAEAAKADDLGKIAEMAFTESAKLVHERDQLWARQLKRQQFLNKVNLSWLGAQIRHPEFLDTLQKSGLYQDIAERSDGSYPNPYLARKVYLAPDPGEEAYQLAMGRLGYEQGKVDDDKESAMLTQPVAETPTPTPAPAQKAEADGEVKAERRGAQKVIEQMETIASKPKGIAGLRSAGQAKTRWSKAELDQLQQRNPNGYEHLIQKHPDLLTYHLS